MDEKVPESEDAPDDAEEEVQFVTPENDLCHLAVRSDLYDESGSGRGITFPLLVTIAVGWVDHCFVKNCRFGPQEGFRGVVKEFDSLDEKGLSPEKAAVDNCSSLWNLLHGYSWYQSPLVRRVLVLVDQQSVIPGVDEPEEVFDGFVLACNTLSRSATTVRVKTCPEISLVNRLIRPSHLDHLSIIRFEAILRLRAAERILRVKLEVIHKLSCTHSRVIDLLYTIFLGTLVECQMYGLSRPSQILLRA